MEIRERKKFMLKVVAKAGLLVASKFNKISRHEVKNKSEHEVVTLADIEAEGLILDSIKKKFPTDSILSEEAGGEKVGKGYLWIIDPLDGTTNFSIGNPVFTISIGLAYNGEVVIGVTYHPLLKQTFFVEKGCNFSLNGQKKTVNSTSELSKAFIAFCHGPDQRSVERVSTIFTKLKPRCRAFRQLGSATFELALVASGKIDAFIMPGVREWDVAAGSLMVEEASGYVTDFSGNKWDLNSRDLLACNKRLLDEILPILNEQYI